MAHTELFDNIPRVKRKKNGILPPNPEADDPTKAVKRGRFPSWLHRKLPKGGNLWETGRAVRGNRLHTVCEEAKCPNLTECWSHKTATFLVLGKECTRSCGFCEIAYLQQPPAPEADEPARVAESVRELGLKHVVITMVARDDLADGGAAHLAEVVRRIREENPAVTIELLTSDFAGNEKAYDCILETCPEIFNHNIETIRAFTPKVRHKATYDRTLHLLSYAKQSGKPSFVKSGLMVGFGESEEEVFGTISDLQTAGCDIITIGQYLQASPRKLRVKEFVPVERFDRYRDYGYSIGVKYMYCGPFVRSSYNSHFVLQQASQR